MNKWVIVQGDYEQSHRWLEIKEEKAYRQTDIIVLVVDVYFIFLKLFYIL